MPAAAASFSASDFTTRLRALIERANKGDKGALADLRDVLDAHPEIWQVCGDLGQLAERTWIELIIGDEVMGAESIRRYIDQLKADLLGPHPTRVEEILADDIAVCYLAARHSEMVAAQPGNQSLGLAALRIRRCDSAQRRLQRALKNLVLLRAKAPAGLAPLNALRLYAGDEDQRQQA